MTTRLSFTYFKRPAPLANFTATDMYIDVDLNEKISDLRENLVKQLAIDPNNEKIKLLNTLGAPYNDIKTLKETNVDNGFFVFVEPLSTIEKQQMMTPTPPIPIPMPPPPPTLSLSPITPPPPTLSLSPITPQPAASLLRTSASSPPVMVVTSPSTSPMASVVASVDPISNELSVVIENIKFTLIHQTSFSKYKYVVKIMQLNF